MKTTITIVLITLACTVGLIALINRNLSNPGSESAGVAAIIDGTQIVKIQAKGGYTPRVTTAKAGVPTIIQVETKGTFDCSASLTVPAIAYSMHLPPSGTTNIEVPAQKANGVVQGICSMGMYNFSIKFS